MPSLIYIHEDQNRNTLRKLFFEEYGFHAECYQSVKEALNGSMVEVDAVVLDIPLQFLDSKKEIKRLKKLSDGKAPIFCLFETTDRAQFEKLEEAGVRYFFPGSQPMEELLRFLSEKLQNLGENA